jgi:hypothetical protein
VLHTFDIFLAVASSKAHTQSNGTSLIHPEPLRPKNLVSQNRGLVAVENLLVTLSLRLQ